MKVYLKKFFAPILNIFEAGDRDYRYKPSYRTILIAVGALFFLLAIVSLIAASHTAQLGAWLPFVVFFAVGSVCEIVGFLGSDRAVARLWGNK